MKVSYIMCERKDSNLFENRFYDSFLNNGGQPYKKPKLDVTSSQTCVTSSNSVKKTEVLARGSSSDTTNVTKLDSNDQLWGEDIDDSVINQCDIIESQALSQDITIDRNLPSNPHTILSHSNKTQNGNIFNSNKGTPSQLTGRAPIRSGTPLYRAASAGNVPDTPVRTSGYFSLNKSNGSQKYNTEGATIHLQSQVNKYKEECKTLREQLQSKEGEVKILRTSLTIKLSEQSKKNRNLTEQLTRERDENLKKINEFDKQINDLSTELEFKCLELKSLNEKLKQSRDHTPSSSSKPTTSNTRKSLDFSRINHSDEKQSKEFGLKELIWGIKYTSLNVHEGSLLAKLIKPDVYCSSVPDNSYSKSSKVSLYEEVVKPITQDPFDALSNCFLPLLMLYKCESFSTYSAKTYVKKIVIESYKSFHRLLKRMKDEGPQGELGDRSKNLLQNSHTILPLTESYSLLSSQRLYSDERGIEVRRMLGLLDLLVKVSRETAKTVINIDFTTVNMSEHKSDNDSNNNNDSKNIFKSFELNDRHHSEDVFSPCRNSVLHVLRDIILLISSERRTLQYNGVLAGTAVFLTSLVEKHLDLTADWQHLILEIAQNILVSCPGPTVILFSCQFLCAVNYYPSVVKKLCVSSVDKAEVEYDRCYTFKNDTCPITVLCYIVQAMGQSKRYLVTDVMTQWFLGLLTKSNKNVLPHWLTCPPLSRSEVTKGCACPWNLSKVMTTLLCEAALVYDSDKSKMNQSEKLMLEKLLERGLLLLYHMVQNLDFGLNLGYIEGQYELFIHTLSMLVIDLPLHPSQRKMMEVMSIQEDHKELLRKKEINSDEKLECSVFKI